MHMFAQNKQRLGDGMHTFFFGCLLPISRLWSTGMHEDAFPCSVMLVPKHSCPFILCQLFVAHQNTDPQVWGGVADEVGCSLISFMKSFCGKTEEGEIKSPLLSFRSLRGELSAD